METTPECGILYTYVEEISGVRCSFSPLPPPDLCFLLLTLMPPTQLSFFHLPAFSSTPWSTPTYAYILKHTHINANVHSYRFTVLSLSCNPNARALSRSRVISRSLTLDRASRARYNSSVNEYKSVYIICRGKHSEIRTMLLFRAFLPPAPPFPAFFPSFFLFTADILYAFPIAVVRDWK